MIRQWVLGLFLFMIIGCSTIQVSNDYNPSYDFKKLHSFAILYNKNKDSLAQGRIVKALTQALEAKGYHAVPKSKADFYVVFHTNVTDKRQIVTDYQQIGVPYHYYGYRHGHRYRSGYGTTTVPVYREINYKEGKIVMDALDAGTKKLFWRGIATDRLKSLNTPEERWEYIKEVVQKLLAPFPGKKPATKNQG